MSTERITLKDIISEMGYLLQTGDADGFLEGLNYAAKMHELNARLKTPEMKAKIEELRRKLEGPSDIMILADQNGRVHLIRK